MNKSNKDIHKILDAKTKDELMGISRKLSLKQYSGLNRQELIQKIIRDGNRNDIEQIIFEKFWKKKEFIVSVIIAIIIFVVGIAYSEISSYKSSQKINDKFSEISQNLTIIKDSDLKKLLEEQGISMDQMKIVKEDSKFIGDNFYQEGLKDVEAQNFQNAFMNFNKSRLFYPNNSAAWNNMAASILRAKGESTLQEARSFIEKSLYLDPNNPIYISNYGYILYYIGSSFYFDGNYIDSLEVINKAINLGINKRELWYFKGALSGRLENSSEQLKTYEEIIERCTDCDPVFLSTMWYNKGVLLLDKNELYTSLEAHDTSIQLYHNDSESWNNWKRALLYLGGLDDKWYDFSKGYVINCTNDVRVTIDNPTSGIEEETPSLVYNESYKGGYCMSANVVYLKNSANISHTYYGNPNVKIPPYRLRNSMDPNNFNITVMWKYVDTQQKFKLNN